MPQYGHFTSVRENLKGKIFPLKGKIETRKKGRDQKKGSKTNEDYVNFGKLVKKTEGKEKKNKT